jgi:hypothetical protein
MAKKKSSKNSKIKLLSPAKVAGKWSPRINGEMTDLISSLPISDGEKQALSNESLSILGKCIDPEEKNGRSLTGLVFGLVQSGKTMSFTSVAALARDNFYRMIVVITGTTTSLANQSVSRLQKDLRLSSRNGFKWYFAVNPKAKASVNIRSKLELWDDPDTVDNLRQTILIAVNKHHSHIGNVTSLLGSLDMSNVSCLIIDDEGDHASLNAKVNRGEESKTYQKILELRRAIPSHTYLQYTATPQAPLLINKIDILSPAFVELIKPGDDYVGGEEIFEKGYQHHVIEIDNSELPSNWSNVHAPPSLERALRMFLIGAADQICGDAIPGKRSMMVHPSQERGPHQVYHGWIKNLMENWGKLLKRTDKSRNGLIGEFKADYDNLKATEPNLSAFEKVAKVLPQVLKIVQLEEVNARSGKTPTVEWSNAPFHILVGGQSMDRGYTVEGLTVTYMPRPSGVGNADTIQQRARFFGYKRKYLGVCRIFLEGGARNAFVNYVHHEKDLRARLAEHIKTQQPLTEWKRKFFLDSDLNPTRSNVLDYSYVRGNFDDEWLRQEVPAAGGEEVVELNRDLVNLLRKHFDFDEVPGHIRRTLEQKHKMCAVQLKDFYESFLVNYKIGDPGDSQAFTGLLLQLEAHLKKNPKAVVQIFLMSPDVKSRVRETSTNGKVKKLFQGANYDRKTGATIYPGDSEIKVPSDLSVQIHMLDLRRGKSTVATNVPSVAIWVPHAYKNAWLVE